MKHGWITAMAVLMASGSMKAAESEWPAPKLTDGNLAKWQKHIFPTASDTKWRKIRWHKELEDAAAEARRLKRPILLWTMNGHPCGTT